MKIQRKHKLSRRRCHSENKRASPAHYTPGGDEEPGRREEVTSREGAVQDRGATEV